MKAPTPVIIILLLLGGGALLTLRTIAQSTTDLSAKSTPFVLTINNLTETKDPAVFESTLDRVDPKGGHGSKMKFKIKGQADHDWPRKEVGGPVDTAGTTSMATVHVTQTIYATTAADLQDVASQLKD